MASVGLRDCGRVPDRTPDEAESGVLRLAVRDASPYHVAIVNVAGNSVRAVCLIVDPEKLGGVPHPERPEQKEDP